MLTYFKPLNRKIGVVTLVMACVLMLGWARSNTAQDLEDVLRFPISKSHTTTFKSRNGTIYWGDYVKPEQSADFGSAVISNDFGPSEPDPSFPEWQRTWFGVNFGQQIDPYDGKRIRFCNIPYWTITIPLTLLSAWLLLSRQREKKPSATVPTE